MTPPRVAEWLLRRVLPHGKRGDSIIGDLREEFRAHAAQAAGGAGARRWYWRQALRLAVRYLAQPAPHPGRLLSRRSPMWFDVSGDVRTALRMVVRHPGGSALIVLTLATAIGAATVGFAFADLALFRGLPVDDPSRVVSIFASDTRGSNPRARVSLPDFLDYRERSRTLERMAVFGDGRAALIENGLSRTVHVGRATADVFASLGQTAVAGRGFRPGDDLPGAPPVTVLSHRYWRDEFGGRADAVGRTLQIGREVFTVVGVITPELEFGSIAEIDLWLPLRTEAAAPRDARTLRLVARLRDGVTFDEAAAELAVIGDGLAAEHPLTNGGWHVRLVPISDLTGGQGFWIVITLFLLSIGLLMAIATANVSNLVMVRALARQQELAVRSALGARSGRLLRQFLVEGFMLSGAAAALALPIAWISLQAIAAFSPEPVFRQIAVDGHEVAFVALLALVCPVAFSLAPARAIANPDTGAVLTTAASRGTTAALRGRSALVVAQVALAVTLLTVSSLSVRSLRQTFAAPIGIVTADLLIFTLEFNEGLYPDAHLARTSALSTRDAIAGLPGVRSVSLMDALPVLHRQESLTLSVDHAVAGPDEALPTALVTRASAGFGEALGVRLLAGDWWREGSTDAAVVSRETAMRYFGGIERAVGRHVSLQRGTERLSLRITGVTTDVAGPDRALTPPARVWTPLEPDQRRLAYVVQAASPDALSGRVRAVVAETTPAVPIEDLRTFDEALRLYESSDYAVLGVLSGFALLALLLATTGLFGVVSFTVSRRTREFGTRMALGASALDVARLVVRQLLGLVALGLAAGLAAGVGLGFTMQGLLEGTSPMDPVAIGGVAVLLTTVSVLATAWPVWRAARVDPVTALRAE